MLIGIAAIVLNGARIGPGSLAAAGAVVLDGADIAARSLVAGVPAVLRRTSDKDVRKIRENAAADAAAAQQYASAIRTAPGPVITTRHETGRS